VQSDKATVDISSKYDGVVTKLYYEVGDMARVGEALIDVQVESIEGEEPEEAEAKPVKTKAEPEEMSWYDKMSPPPMNDPVDEVSDEKALWELCDKDHDGRVTRIELILALRQNQHLADKLGLRKNIKAEDQSRYDFEDVFRELDQDSDKGANPQTVFFILGKLAT